MTDARRCHICDVPGMVHLDRDPAEGPTVNPAVEATPLQVLHPEPDDSGAIHYAEIRDFDLSPSVLSMVHIFCTTRSLLPMVVSAVGSGKRPASGGSTTKKTFLPVPLSRSTRPS